jgi:hypothetical protein
VSRGHGRVRLECAAAALVLAIDDPARASGPHRTAALLIDADCAKPRADGTTHRSRFARFGDCDETGGDPNPSCTSPRVHTAPMSFFLGLFTIGPTGVLVQKKSLHVGVVFLLIYYYYFFIFLFLLAFFFLFDQIEEYGSEEGWFC